MTFRAALLFLALCLAACSSSDDAGGSKQKPGKTLSFRPATAPSGSSITLKAKSLENGKLVLELVGNQLSDVYGVAFRLKYDPAALTFSSFEPAAPFASPDAITLSDTKTAGLLVGTLSLKGKQNGISANGAAIGVLTFTLAQEAPTKLEFVGTRSAVIGATTGTPISAAGWAAGDLVLE